MYITTVTIVIRTIVKNRSTPEYRGMTLVPYTVQLCCETMYCTVDLNLGYHAAGRNGYRTYPFVNDKYKASHYCYPLVNKEKDISHGFYVS
jgi:hypothetical protein